MSDTELQFRTATFGGFQKQDVLNYIETSGQEHREKLAELTRQAEQARQENGELREKLSQAEQQCSADGETARRMEEELAQARQEAEQLRARLGAAEAERDALRADLEEARGKLAQAEPAAAAYQQVKERTAGIELEAHCRAQAVQAEAEERIEQAHQELGEWLDKVRRDYGGLRADMDAAITQAHSELERARAALEAVSDRFAVQDGRLEKLAQACAGERKVPDPLPLDQDR